MKVPFVDLYFQHQDLAKEINTSIKRVILNSSFILGPEVKRFESMFADYIGVKHAIGTNNGTTALLIALKALNLQKDDEVIIPAMTFYATAEVVAFIGAKPVFVDINPRTFNINTKLIEAKITQKTKIILPVHLYGHPADLNDIKKIANQYKLKVLGDCAHAHGAIYQGKKVGSIEDIAAFSFYPSKNLGCLGEAGIITTDDDNLFELCRKYRDHGSTKKFEHTHIGINGRMAGLNAAVLAVKLPFLDKWNDQRREVAYRYNSLLSNMGIHLPQEGNGIEHVYHVYQIQIEKRDLVLNKMKEAGIGVNVHYPVAMHQHKGFEYLGYHEGDFPIAEQLAEHTMSLPCYPGLQDHQIEHIAEQLKLKKRRLPRP